MIKAMLAIPKNRDQADAYDALAVALCDFQNYRYRAAMADRGR